MVAQSCSHSPVLADSRGSPIDQHRGGAGSGVVAEARSWGRSPSRGRPEKLLDSRDDELWLLGLKKRVESTTSSCPLLRRLRRSSLPDYFSTSVHSVALAQRSV
jgi:hypothetical protein